MDDAAAYLSRHPHYKHRSVPWNDAHTSRLVEVWRALLESQNGEGVDGASLPPNGGAFGHALDFVPAGCRVLVLGAGRGEEVAFAAARGYSAHGFTLGPMNVCIAHESLGLSLCFWDAHVSCLQSRSFDAVIAMQVVEHSPAPLILLLECARVLKPDGLLIVETPSPVHHTGGRSLHHVLCPTARQLLGLFEKAAFHRIGQYIDGGRPLHADELDRVDYNNDLLTVGHRVSEGELLTYEPAVRRIVLE